MSVTVLQNAETKARKAYDEAKAELDQAQIAKAAAEESLLRIQRMQMEDRHSTALDRALNAPDLAYYNSDSLHAGEGRISRFSVSDERPYILPFGKGYPKWSPFDVENAAFGKSWLANTTALICRRRDEDRTRPSRLIFTSGVGPTVRDSIGTVFVARHDQTGGFLGVYEIVGVVIYDLEGNVARTLGETPDVKLSQSTYK